MRRNRSSWTSWIAPGLVAVGLILCPAARGQDEEAAGGGGDAKGRPYDGYIATGMLCGLALYVVAKTARR